MATNTPSPDAVIIARQAYRTELVNEYEATARRLERAYRRTLEDIRPAANQLIQRYTAIDDRGERVLLEQLTGWSEYERLLLRTSVELDEFSSLIRANSLDIAEDAAERGANAALELATSTAAPDVATQIRTAWIRPDPEALTRLAGYVDSEAFANRMAHFGGRAAANLADGLLTLTAQGKGARQIARYLENWYAVPYASAEQTVRTLQMYSYRTANHQAYRENSLIVRGWMWYASLDTRVCPSCISQHGREFDHSSILNDHHNGRCTPIPITHGAKWPDREPTGPEWFASLSPDDQAEIFRHNKSLYEAFRRGDVDWSDMSQPYGDALYGEMLRATSLKEALTRQNRTVRTINGVMPRDNGIPGDTLESLQSFLETSNGPLANELWGYVGYAPDATIQITGDVRDAAKRFVEETMDWKVSKSYILENIRYAAEQNGVIVTEKQAERLGNQDAATRARAILTLARTGKIRLTEAQQRRLNEAADGNYLNMVYDGREEGSIVRHIQRGGGSLRRNSAEARRLRDDFLRTVGRGTGVHATGGTGGNRNPFSGRRLDDSE